MTDRAQLERHSAECVMAEVGNFIAGRVDAEYLTAYIEGMVETAWTISRGRALEEAAMLCEAERERTLSVQSSSGDTVTDLMLRQVAYLGFDASAAAIRASSRAGDGI